MIGIPVVLYLVHLGGFSYFVFIYIVAALGLREYGNLLRLGAKPVNRAALYIFGLLLPLLLYFDTAVNVSGPDNFTGLIISLMVIGVFISEMFRKEKFVERMGLTVLGIFMVSWCLSHMFMLRDLEKGEVITYLMIISTWVADTAAYTFGKTLGRHKLTSISPKKTWEGAVAGFVFAVGASLLIARISGWAVSLNYALAAGIIIGTFGQMSDIAESLVKRSVGAKDSSNILPGHGGILDRFDSYIFLAPVLYYFTLMYIPK